MSVPQSLFLRKWQLVIKSAPSSGQQTVITLPDPKTGNAESLRVTFDVYTRFWKDIWYAHICIYNPNEQLSNFLLGQGQNSSTQPSPSASNQTLQIQQAMEVTLSAGYQKGENYGVIWDGFVLQPLFERENQTDFKVTLNCVLGLDEIGRNWVGRTFSQQSVSQMQLIQSIAKNSYHPIPIGTISSTLTKKLPRAQTFFGSPKKILDEVARDNNMNWFLGQKGLLNFGKLDEDLSVSSSNAIQYTPTTGIVGTPVQLQYGIQFRLLLDSRVQVKKPLMCVNISNTQVRQLLKQAGVLPSILSNDGTYAVIEARYRGDTRGQEWYTDVIGALLAKDKWGAIQLAAGDLQAFTG
jgi:hypothetical protein